MSVEITLKCDRAKCCIGAVIENKVDLAYGWSVSHFKALCPECTNELRLMGIKHRDEIRCYLELPDDVEV